MKTSLVGIFMSVGAGIGAAVGASLGGVVVLAGKSNKPENHQNIH